MGSFFSKPGDKPCTMKAERKQFEENKVLQERVLLKFKGVDGLDVYNCSVPFKINDKVHILGRVESRDEWATSITRLFEKTGEDEFTLVPNAVTFHLEDPYVSCIHGKMVYGGVRVIKNHGKVIDYFCEFYFGTPDNLKYFTSGPDRMKDIRLVELENGKIGIFSHHKSNHECLTGFAVIDNLEQLSAEAIDSAVPIDHAAFGDAWGGVNQAYLLDTGKIGCISHHGYLENDENGKLLNVYCITSFVYEPSSNKVYKYQILGTKGCYPPCEPKVPRLADCAFVSGIVMRDDGKCDLYSGLGDTHEGRMVIDYPFEGHGKIVSDLHFECPAQK